jgi:hypothetical protein
MDGLRLLLAAGLGSNASPVRQWRSDLIFSAVVGVVVFICAIMVAMWGALTLYLALQPQFSDMAAAGLTALAFVAIIGIFLGGLKWQFSRHSAPSQPEQHSGEMAQGNLGSFAHLMPPPGQPMRAWDLATLVAIGVITGLSKGNEPR